MPSFDITSEVDEPLMISQIDGDSFLRACQDASRFPAGDQMQKGIDLYVKTHQKDLPPGVEVELLEGVEVGEGDGLVIEDMNKARESATMLDIRPAGLAGGGHVKGVASEDERALVGGEMVAGHT